MVKKIFISILFLIFSYASFSQAFAPRSSPAITAADARLKALLNFYYPRTHGLTLNGGLDSLGAVIYEDSSRHVWYRDTVLSGGHKWTMILNSSDEQVPIQWQNQGTNIGGAGSANTVNIIGNGATASYGNGVITISVTAAASVHGVLSINGDTTSNALFVTGFSGTSPNIVTSHGVSTWNNPLVNTLDTGLVTPALFNTWNAKQNALTFGNVTSPTSTISISGGTGSVIGSGLTLSLPSIITAGSCTNCILGVDAYGRIISYANGTTSAGTVTSVSGIGTVNGLTLTGTVTSSGSLVLGGTLSGITNSNLSGSAGITSANLATTGVTAGSFTNSNITVNAQGQITSISNGSSGSGSTITNVGSGFDIAYAGTNNVKRVTTINGIIGDTSVSNTFRLQVDSSKFATKSFVNLGFVPNAGNTTSIQEGLLSARPLAGITGRLYYTTDAAANFIYLDNGSGWVRIDSVAAAPPQSFQTTLNIGNTINRNDSLIGNFAFTFASNSAIQIPGGNTSQAPSNALGWLRYNSDSSYNGFGNRPTFNNGTGYHMLAYVSDIPTGKDSIFLKAVNSTGDSLLTVNGSDTIYQYKFVDSAGFHHYYNNGHLVFYATGSSGTPNSNIGAGYRLVAPNVSQIKTLFCSGCTLDSTTNTNALTISIAGLTNSNLSGSAGITNANLANSTISGVSLGGNLFSLTNGYGINTFSFNGSATQTVIADTTKLATTNSVQNITASKYFQADQFIGTGNKLNFQSSGAGVQAGLTSGAYSSYSGLILQPASGNTGSYLYLAPKGTGTFVSGYGTQYSSFALYASDIIANPNNVSGGLLTTRTLCVSCTVPYFDINTYHTGTGSKMGLRFGADSVFTFRIDTATGYIHFITMPTYGGTPAYTLVMGSDSVMYKVAYSGSGGGFYQTVQNNGTSQTQRAKLNFIGATVADNSSNGSTDITFSGGAVGTLRFETTATAAQTSFTISSIGSGVPQFFINGIRISNAAYTISGTTVTYVPANNSGYVLTTSDRINIDY